MMRFVYTGLHSVRLPLFLILFVLLLAACAGRNRDTPPAPPTPATSETAPAAPTPGESPAAAPDQPAAESPLAAPNTSPLAQPNQSPLAQPPASPLGTPTAVPQVETEPGTGAVTGVLLVQTDEGIKPVSGMIIAVANVLTNTELTNDAEAAAAFRYMQQDSPQTNTDEDGFFAIRDVPPGRYGLVLDLVMSSYILRQPGAGGDLVIAVEADEQVDLGTLVYDQLPDPAMPD